MEKSKLFINFTICSNNQFIDEKYFKDNSVTVAQRFKRKFRIKSEFMIKYCGNNLNDMKS